MAKSYLNDTGLNILIQQLSNKIKSHTSGSITDTNGVLDNPNNFATTLAIVDYVKNITDNGAIIVPITETIMALTTEVGKYYRLDVPVETLAVTLPAMGVVTSTKTVVIYLTGGTTPAVTITSADNKRVVFQNGYKIEAGKTYKVNALFDGSAWIVSALTIILPPPPMNIITYEASAKLAETTTNYLSGLHTDAFSGKSGQLTMTSHTFENGVGTIEFNGDIIDIGDGAFNNCTDLTSITIPDSVTSIGSSAFFRCSGLTSITIPNSVTSIGSSAFFRCSGLTSITIPNSVTSIGNETFYGCLGLTSIVIPDSVTSIGEDAFSSCYFTSSNFVNNSSLNEVAENYWGATIVDTDINGLLIKNNRVVKYRGTSNSVTIPNTVTSIGYLAFLDCTGLTSVTIGSGVTSIGISAFSSCTSLTSITSNAMTAPTIQSDTFQDVKTGGTLYVPSGSTGYDVWMGTGDYYLGKYNWTKVEQ